MVGENVDKLRISLFASKLPVKSPVIGSSGTSTPIASHASDIELLGMSPQVLTLRLLPMIVAPVSPSMCPGELIHTLIIWFVPTLAYHMPIELIHQFDNILRRPVFTN